MICDVINTAFGDSNVIECNTHETHDAIVMRIVNNIIYDFSIEIVMKAETRISVVGYDL